MLWNSLQKKPFGVCLDMNMCIDLRLRFGIHTLSCCGGFLVQMSTRWFTSLVSSIDLGQMQLH